MVISEIRRSSMASYLRMGIPKRPAHVLREFRKHNVETDAYSFADPKVGIDGVWRPGWKYEKRSVSHCHNDLIGVLGGQFHHRRPDDPRLISRIVKIDGIRSLVRLDVINAAQEIVWVTVNMMRGAGRADVGPARRDLEPLGCNLQVIQQDRCDLVDAGNQIPTFVELMQVVVGLPSLSGLEFGKGSPHIDEPMKDIMVYPLSALPLELRLPNQCWKETQGVRRVE